MPQEGEKSMKKMAISLTTILTFALTAVLSPWMIQTRAQTQNHSSKTEITEAFTFPNECTGELMDVTDTTVVTCHDQLRADGTFYEKCQIVQKVQAVGQTTGITLSGTGTFKDEFTATDDCNFSFTNRGSVRLISTGSDVNLVLSFDDVVRMQNCVLTTDSHMVSTDCRGDR
jgi:hypothetical protein